MPRIKIVEKGWLGFTGNMGTALFVDGEAEVTQIEAHRIGANIKIVNVDNDEQISASADIVRVKHLSAEVEVPRPMKLISPEIEDAEIDEAAQAFLDDIETEGEVEEDDILASIEDEPTVRTKLYTREEHGIRGIREIATPLDIKSTSITALIDMILKTQK